MSMKKVSVSILAVLIFVQCGSNSKDYGLVSATVRKIKGHDCCEWVFELENGTLLVPFPNIYNATSEVNEDPLLDFEFQDGKQVFISYFEIPCSNNCSVGPVAKITRVTEVTYISVR